MGFCIGEKRFVLLKFLYRDLFIKNNLPTIKPIMTKPIHEKYLATVREKY